MPLANGTSPDSVPCPECGEDTRVGLPRSAVLEAVTRGPSSDIDDGYTDGTESRKKRRRSACRDGHAFYVYFEF
jgi:hypothetical protein